MILEYKLRIDTEKGTFTIIDLKSNIEKSISSLINNNIGPIAVLKDKSLSFNYDAIEMMNFAVKDRIAIAYDNDGNPLIGKEEFIGKKGNFLSKYNSIFCSGFNNKKISDKGKIFQIEQYGENIFRLVTEKEEKREVEKVKKVVEKQEIDLSDIIPENNQDDNKKELDDLFKDLENINEEDNYIDGFKFVI